MDESKLSSRFNKKEEKVEINFPKKFSFSKNPLPNIENTSEVLQKSSKEADFAELSTIEPEIKKALFDKIDLIPVWFEYTPEKQKDLIKSFVENKLENVLLTQEDKDKLVEDLFLSIAGFGPLDYLIAKENVSTIYVNGTNSVHIEIGGKILNTEMKLTEKQFNFILNNITNLSGVKPDKSKNIYNFRIKNLYITVINKNIALSGTNITIRKNNACVLDDILNRKMLNKEIFDFIISSVNAKKNIVISGDINSGKTSLLNIILNNSILDKRAVLLEEFSQINIESDLFIRFVLNKRDLEYYQLLSNVLKISPDYLVSDINEPIPELSAVSGNITTIRATSVDSAISKLISEFISEEKLPEKYAKTKVFTNFDYIIQLNNMPDGTKRVTSIVELTPARTAALSIKTITKLVGEQYISEIPQPITSIRADSLISPTGSMSSRFCLKD